MSEMVGIIEEQFQIEYKDTTQQISATVSPDYAPFEKF